MSDALDSEDTPLTVTPRELRALIVHAQRHFREVDNIEHLIAQDRQMTARHVIAALMERRR